MDHASKVEAHTLFYITGVGITILLMNLLVGVLSNNFEVYEDQSAVLFLRARAKLMLELQGRPWTYMLQWLSCRLLRNEESENEKSEPSGVAIILLLLCFGPLVPLFLYSESKFLGKVLLSGITKRRCCGSVLLLLCSPMLFILSACLALILMFFRLVFQMQLSGIFYMVAVSFGCCGAQGDKSPEDCHIWLVVRAEPPMEALRSLRSEMKTLGFGWSVFLAQGQHVSCSQNQELARQLHDLAGFAAFGFCQWVLLNEQLRSSHGKLRKLEPFISSFSVKCSIFEPSQF